MNLRIISPGRGGKGREWGNEETWQAKAQKNRFIIEIHVISHLLLLSLADCQCVRPLSGSGSGQTHSLLGHLHISSYRWSWSCSWSWSWSWSWCATLSTVAVCLQSPSAIELMPRGHLKIPRAFARRRVTHFYEVICVWSALNAAHRALRTAPPLPLPRCFPSLPCGKIEINSWKMCAWKSPNEILLIAMENLLKLSHAPLTSARRQTYFKYRSKYYSVCFMCRCRNRKKITQKTYPQK